MRWRRPPPDTVEAADPRRTRPCKENLLFATATDVRIDSARIGYPRRAVGGMLRPCQTVMTESLLTEELQWQAVLARDASFDGRFVYGVLTTAVYCRPSCPSRRPLRENVRFYATPHMAESGGMRPCKRCRPNAHALDHPMDERMRALCRYIEDHPEEAPTLDALSRMANLSPFHLQRRFKAAIGVTPRQYAEACRLRLLKRSLRGGDSVTGAIYTAGFGSTSRVYERVASRMGMTPGQYRAGGAGVEISYATAWTPLGLLLMAATDRGLCFVQLGDSGEKMVERLRAEYPAAMLSAMPAGAKDPFRQWMQALCDYLRGKRGDLNLPTDIRGTAFQLQVWDYLCRIPCGEIRTYQGVANAIGRPGATRAVANACAANRVALVIPCHRVIRGDGGLGGYRWGVERKRALIAREHEARAECPVPGA